VCSSVQGAPQSPQMCRRSQCLLVLGPSNSQSGSNGSRNMAARAAGRPRGRVCQALALLWTQLSIAAACDRCLCRGSPSPRGIHHWVRTTAAGRVDPTAASAGSGGNNGRFRPGLAGWPAATSDGWQTETTDAQPGGCAPGANGRPGGAGRLGAARQGGGDDRVLRLHVAPSVRCGLRCHGR
jgi:hypothetical protein